MSEWIHVNSLIDDFGLTAGEFRVYAHLAGRRASSEGIAWPSVVSVASVCRLHKDTVFKVLASLESKGLVVREAARGRSNRYRFPSPKSIKPPIVVEGTPLETLREGAVFEGTGGIVIQGTQRYSKEGLHKKTPLPARAGEVKFLRKARPSDPVFEALATVDNVKLSELTPGGRGALNRARSDIVKASPNVTPEEIARREFILRKMYPHTTLSATALARHWARCGTMPLDPSSYAYAERRRVEREAAAEAEAKAKREDDLSQNTFLESLTAEVAANANP